MSDSSGRKRRRSPSGEDSRRHNHHKHKRSRSVRRDHDSNENNTLLSKLLASVDDMKKEFATMTTRVNDIENTLSQKVLRPNVDEDCLSIHPPASIISDNMSPDISAIEAPLAGLEPPLADCRSDFSHSTVTKESPAIQVPQPSCEFFDPESTSLRKWSPSEPFKAFLDKHLKRRLTVDQVNEIIGETSLPETDSCVAPYLDKDILNYVPAGRRKAVENRDKDLNLIQRALLNSAAPLCCLHDRLERKDNVSNDELLTILQQSLCLLGSANHITTITRRKKILGAINPDKIQLADNDFPNAGKMLFGDDLPPLAAKHSELSRSLSKNLQKPQYNSQPPRQNLKPIPSSAHKSYAPSHSRQPFRGSAGQGGPKLQTYNNSNFRARRAQPNKGWSRQ